MSDEARFFDAIARRYDRVYARSGHESRASLARVLAELRPASRVLDLGVGTGRELPALLDAGHEVVGLDLSTEMIALCARRARPILLVQGDLWAPLPWDAASFDAVLALHGTLAHAPSEDARRSLPKEVARVLRPGGVFVAEVPTATWLEQRAKEGDPSVVWLGAGRGRFVDDASRASVEVWLATPEEWRGMFEGVLEVQVEERGNGELVILGRRSPAPPASTP